MIDCENAVFVQQFSHVCVSVCVHNICVPVNCVFIRNIGAVLTSKAVCGCCYVLLFGAPLIVAFWATVGVGFTWNQEILFTRNFID